MRAAAVECTCPWADRACCECQVILEEFGKYINLTTGADMAQRNQYYGIIFDEINKLTDAGKPIKVSRAQHDMTVFAVVCHLLQVLQHAQHAHLIGSR